MPLLAVLLACSEKPAATVVKAEPAAIRMDGSSTVFPISEAVAEEFRKGGNTAQVTVGISGTGGGFKKFCAGETDLANASRPIKPSETEACAQAGISYVELPVAYDGLAIVVNPKNDWLPSITVQDLKKIWAPDAQTTVMKWKDVNPAWPDKAFKLYGPGTDSGTYDYFTEAINGKEDASRGDFTSSEDDNVLVQGVAGDEGSLGYFGLAYYEENQDKLKLVPVEDGNPDNGAGPIAPTAVTVQDGTYQPLSRPLFVYVSAKALERKEIQDFVRFYLANASGLASEVGYIALPASAAGAIQARVDARKTGTVFPEGPKVGVSLATLLGDPGAPAPAVATETPPVPPTAPPAQGH